MVTSDDKTWRSSVEKKRRSRTVADDSDKGKDEREEEEKMIHQNDWHIKWKLISNDFSEWEGKGGFGWAIDSLNTSRSVSGGCETQFSEWFGIWSPILYQK